MKRVIAYFVSGMRTGSFFLFVFGVIIPCLSQHRLSRCECPQYPGDLFDEWDNGGLDIHS